VESKNQITVAQLALACRHYEEMRKAGVTENLAIRTLEHFVEVYSKLCMGASATPYQIDKVKLWSVKARKLRKAKPNARPGELFRIEHGTPRRDLARLVLKLSYEGKLTERTMQKIARKHYKVAVITLEEDKALNKIVRSKMPNSKMPRRPDDRWKLAGIKFPDM
jgi:hypothetical protein